MMPTGISIMPARTLKRARQQEIDVGLLELQLARVLEPLDQRVFELELADEPDAIAEAMRDQQDEAMEVEAPVFEFELVEVEVHVARDRRASAPRVAAPAGAAASAPRREAGQAPGRPRQGGSERHVFAHGFRM